jgi:acyl-CoA synthetase (AMP-forming)/AMP-acid ligase II
MHLSSILDRAAGLWPRRTGVVCELGKLNWSAVADRVDRLARVLAGPDLEPGDRIAVLCRNHHAFFEAYHAAARAGLVLVPVNVRLTGRDIRFIMEDSGARRLIADREFEEKVADAGVEDVLWTGSDYEDALRRASMRRSAAGESDLAQIYYTSGTTGRPKGVMLTHGNVAVHALAAVAELSLSDRDVWAHVAPLYHLADAWATFAITWVGGRHVFVPQFESAAVLETFREQGVTLTNLIPTMLNSLVNEPGAADANYPSLRVLLSGGAPIAPALVRRVMHTFGCDYVQTYGLTETSPYLTVSILKEHLRNRPAKERFRYLSRTGRPFLTVDLRVVRDDGEDVRPNDREVGEIRVKGPTVTPGYWNRPEETEAAFEDGWLKTGDLAVVDGEGYVNIVDRAKDMIVTGGENVYSTEIEYAIQEHHEVLECAVIGIPDEKWGEAVKAVVVPTPGSDLTEDGLIGFLKDRVADYKLPRSVDFAEELPRTGSGKITKRPLRDPYWEGHERRVN